MGGGVQFEILKKNPGIHFLVASGIKLMGGGGVQFEILKKSRYALFSGLRNFFSKS